MHSKKSLIAFIHEGKEEEEVESKQEPEQPVSVISSIFDSAASRDRKTGKQDEEEEKKKPEQVTITKVYDFAGENVE